MIDAPPALFVLLAKRSSFRVLWNAATADHARALALDLASRKWQSADIAAALCHHPTAGISTDVADSATGWALSQRSKDVHNPAQPSELMPEPVIKRLFMQHPNTCEILCGRHTFVTRTSEIGTRGGLRNACLDFAAVVPWLPPPEDFHGWLAEQLQDADRVEQPPEVNEEAVELAIVSRALTAASAGRDSIDETRAGNVATVEGYKYLYLPEFLLLKVRQIMPSLTSRRLAAILRELGWKPHRWQTGGDEMNVWRLAWDGAAPESREAKLQKIREESQAKEAKNIQRQYVAAQRTWHDNAEEPHAFFDGEEK